MRSSSRKTDRRIVSPVMRPSIPALVLLVLYVLVLFALTMAPTPRRLPIQMVNLIPFKTIMAGIERGGLLLNVNVLGNIVAFVPLGVLVPMLDRRLSTPGVVLIASAFLSVSIEVLQWLFARRVADIDDVILNIVGALVGYGCIMLLAKTMPAASEDSFSR